MCNAKLATFLFAISVSAQDLAIVGGTIIDGNGGPPIMDGVILIKDQRISAVGSRAATPIPAGTKVMQATGCYIIPGLIDTNVHLSLYGGARDRYETLAKYYWRENDIVLEAAQIQLRYGVTTVRDSYGMLEPLTYVRDAIERHQAIGARILAAGNIVGWGGPYSTTFSLTPQGGLTLFQEQMNEAIAQGAGENLADLSPAELRIAINKYLDKGPDFLKYGATSHFSQPSFIGFSPDAQKTMVEEAHKRGKAAEVHSTTLEGLRLSLAAGIDLIQHPEILTPRELPGDLISMIKARNVICSMLASTITGEVWQKHVQAKEAAQKKLNEEEKQGTARPKTMAEERRRATALGMDLETRRLNARRLIAEGCTVTVGTDSYWASAPEFAIEPKPENQSHGIGTILAIEGLVELGMTPAQAIVAGTRNGAIACRRLKDFGTLERGKLADLVLLDANPLEDIHNIRKVRAVLKEGAVIEFAHMPGKRVLSTGGNRYSLLLTPDDAEMKQRAPDVSRVRLYTSEGEILIELNRDWAPLGVDHFYNLVRAGYYDGVRFARVIKDRWVQFGINGDPEISNLWRTRTFPDDPRRESNTRGAVAFAFALPNGRTTQVFINLTDNSPTHDKEPFAPIGRVIQGMDVADRLYAGYAESSGSGIRSGKQEPLFSGGNAYLLEKYPRLDWIRQAIIAKDGN